MSQIIDVSPVASPNLPDPNHSPMGRMLSIACSPDGQVLFAGSYSNLWVSYDNGQTWEQVVWPQPDSGQLDVPGSIGGWCVVDMAVALGWRVDKHPRFLAKLTRSGFMDIVGFGDCGVWTALGNGDGTFQPPRVVIANLGYQAGGWRVDLHPRLVVDLNADGCADIVGFGYAGVWTALGNGDGTFQQPQMVLGNYGYAQDWRVDKHPRFLAQLTNSGFADIVGFGEDGVWVALGNGDGTFSEPHKNPVLHQFGHHQGWQVDRHPRFVAPLTDSGFADIVGFGDDGVWTALSNGDGTFRTPHPNPVLGNFGYNQGWRVDRHPRFLAPLTSSGFSDIVGFFNDGVHTAISTGDGRFHQPTPQPVLDNFGYNQSWRVDKHARFVVDLDGDGLADIAGCGDAGVWTAIGTGNGKFGQANFVLANLGFDQGWRVDKHPRLAGDLTGNGRADIVGFGDAGVWTTLGDGHGGFPTFNFVLENFGYLNTVLALVRNDRVVNGRGIWKSSDGGSNWSQVYQFPAGEAVGQLVWALGSDHLVYAAGGNALAISKNAGTTFETVFPWGSGPASAVNHVAVWQNAPADPYPAVIYALGYSTMFLSFDGGVTWMKDQGSIPPGMGSQVSSIGNGNAPSVMVISPRWPLEVYVLEDGSTPAVLHHGDYTTFLGSQISNWDTLTLPNLGGQDSGNVFLATTQKGRGDLLFYGAQRSIGFVGPLSPSAPSDWQPMGGVHVDLHGILLSPDFQASLENGTYTPVSGTVWLLSDGGISWSKDGGQTFQPAQNAKTLSCVNVAGVAIPGGGPALSLNTGDNDGFYSPDGGQSWIYQDYGGGDNDCSYADPLRFNSMLVFTPRWNTSGQFDHTRNGQTVTVYENGLGGLPDAGANTPQRHVVPGPPLLPPSVPWVDLWNAGSYYGSRGSRPIVLTLNGETPPPEGDYVFILNPATNPVLVRTQNILDISSRGEWLTTATGPGQGANVYLQGPPLPFSGMGVVQAAGGHTNTVLYVGGNGTLWTWQQAATKWKQLVPAPAVGNSVAVNMAVRFFVSPYNPNLIYVLDSDSVKRSDDGGATWKLDSNLQMQLTWNNQIAISPNDNSGGVGDYFDLVLTDMQFYPDSALVRFAVGQGGAFYTFDGVNWMCLLHAGALTGRPANCYFDWISDPYSPTLYVAFAGRSLVKITDIQISPIF